MKKNYVKLIKRQLSKLREEDFDLEVWKASTVGLLQRILGEDDPRIKSITDIKVDYGSWALRDATASYNPKETSKRKGEEILSLLVDEIEILGVENKGNASEQVAGILSEQTLLKVDKPRELLNALKKERKDTLAAALYKILSH